MAIGFPASAGCLTYVVAVSGVGLVLLCVPAARGWLGGTITVVPGLIVAAVVHHILLAKSVCRWTCNVLIPRAQEANVCLKCVVAVVDDVPGSKLGLTEELWPMKDQLQTICGLLTAEGKLDRAPTHEVVQRGANRISSLNEPADRVKMAANPLATKPTSRGNDE
jgi:hypothetical protein